MEMNKIDSKDLIVDTIRIHQRLFYKIAYTYMRNHDDTQDVLHNAYEKAYVHEEQLKNKDHIKNWLITIIRHEANAIIRRNALGREKEHTQFSLSHKTEYTDDVALKVDLKNALRQLTDEQRDLIVMKYLLGYKQREIAKMCKLPTGTIKSRTSRALDALREILGGDFNE